MPSDKDMLPNGLSVEDTRYLHGLFNRLACEVGGADVPEAVIVRRLRILSGWFLEASDHMAGVSAEELGVLDCVRFWRARANGARGEP